MTLEDRLAAIEAEHARLSEQMEKVVRAADQAEGVVDPMWRTHPKLEAELGPHICSIDLLDAGQLLTLQRAAYVSEAQLHGDLFLPPLTQTLAELEAELAESTALGAVAWTRMVGAVRARLDVDVWRIGRLVVAPDRQGKGIGGRLLEAIEAEAPTEAGGFALFTGAGSDRNIALYERHGYVVSRYEEPPSGPRLVHLTKPRD